MRKTGSTKRSNFKFEQNVSGAFAFLSDLGFAEIELSPTLVRYRKNGIEIDVYYGRQSYEIGAGVTAFGVRYSISEIIRACDIEVAKHFHYPVATTPEELTDGIEKLSFLMKHYGSAALTGDLNFFSILEKQRILWSKMYAVDVLAEQLRPHAESAFRDKDFETAADLYVQIRETLTPAELKKLDYAEKQCGSQKH